jgi:hypothetical protein
MSTMNEFKFYSTTNPNHKSLVNFIFTNRIDNCFECFLTDYNKKAIMPFHMATQKSNLKHKNINTLAPLNKQLIGEVEEINDDTIIISMAFVDKASLEYKLFVEETSKNKLVISSVKRYTTKNNINFINYWEEHIYPLDEERLNEEDILSLFDYILKVGSLEASILSYLQDCDAKVIIPNIKFKLVSTNGCSNIKRILQLALNNTNTTEFLDVMIESAPNYFVSSKVTTEFTYHKKFLQELEDLSKNPENNIFYANNNDNSNSN